MASRPSSRPRPTATASRATASPETIYALLAEGASWPRWSPIGSFELAERAIRVFRTKRAGRSYTSVERVEELVPHRRLSYSLRRGLPLRGYLAHVELTPHDGGTTIHWHSSFDTAVPGTGWLYRAMLRRFIGQCAGGLAEYAGPRNDTRIAGSE